LATKQKLKIAILDDYQGAALKLADWSQLQSEADIVVFRDHLTEEDSIIQRLKRFDIICVMRERTPLPRKILENLPKLKLISSTGHKNASIDIEAAKERGITVCNTASPSVTSHGADELTWALILALVRNLPRELDSVRKGGWQISVGCEIHGKTMGIVGLGRIGKSTASIARAFGMNVIAWSQNLTREIAERAGATLVSKEELFRTSDIVSIHLVLSERTRGLVGERELGLMKPTAYLVNTSRGPIVDESALLKALKENKIAGAGLDVYDDEPLPENHPFRSLDNVITTPHIGFVTQEGYRAFYSLTVENILAWMQGKPVRILEH
jgi:phosphoglycerate dehydrogenase-like enzyme